MSDLREEKGLVPLPQRVVGEVELPDGTTQVMEPLRVPEIAMELAEVPHRRRFVYDKTLCCLVEVGLATRTATGLQIISDYEPYITVAGDVAQGGNRAVIGGRAQHRDFLRRNGYVEIGNEFNHTDQTRGAPRPGPNYIEQRARQAERVQAIKRTIDDYRSGRIARGEVSRSGER